MGIVSNLATTIVAPVNFVLMQGLLRAAERNLPYYNGVMPGNLTKNEGSFSVKWRRLDNIAAATTPLTELSGDQTAVFFGRTAATPIMTDITATVQKYGNYIPHTEELDLINVNSRSAQLFDKLGENAGHSLNLLMRDVFDGASNVRFANSVASNTLVNSAIGAEDIQAAVNFLNRNSAMKQFGMATGDLKTGTNPVRASYYGICHSDVEEDVRGLTGFIPVEQYGGYTDTNVGEFGAVNGVRWASTEIAPVSTDVATTTLGAAEFRGTGTNNALWSVYSSVIYGKEALGSVGLGTDHAQETYSGLSQNPNRIPSVLAINKPPGSAGAADPFNEVGSLAWKAFWAGSVLNQNWVVPVRTLATNHAI
jgi:N4-gp56 family major capsid protein